MANILLKQRQKIALPIHIKLVEKKFLIVVIYFSRLMLYFRSELFVDIDARIVM